MSKKFRKKPVIIEAITFNELVEYGKTHSANIVNGMPWSFDYMGHPVTHENDDCYLISTLEGTIRMDRSDTLVTGANGEIYLCKLGHLLTDEEIRLNCFGEGTYWAGEMCLNATDPPAQLMPVLQRISKAQDAKTSAYYQQVIEGVRAETLKELYKWLADERLLCEHCGTIVLESSSIEALRRGELPIQALQARSGGKK